MDDNYITPSGMLAGAHLVGQGKANRYFQSEGKGEVPKDGFETPITKYIHDMSNFDVKKETDNYQYDSNEAAMVQPLLDKISGYNADDGYLRSLVDSVTWEKFRNSDAFSKSLPELIKSHKKLWD